MFVNRFLNYRTSHTASLSGPVEREARKRMERAARLPPGFSEYLQLVRYDRGEWYKEHHDFFHNWMDPYEKAAGIKTKKRKEGKFQAWKERALGCEALQGRLPSKVLNKVTTVPTTKNGQRMSLGDPEDNIELLISRYMLISPKIARLLDEGWIDWVNENLARNANGLAGALLEHHPDSDALFAALQVQWESDGGCKDSRELAQDGWENQQYLHDQKTRARKRKYRVEPNRHVTVFGYLNDDFVGGETVFPLAKVPSNAKQIIVRASGVIENSVNPAERKGMEECSRGLRIEPIKGAAALFYSKTGSGVNDYSSLHGGCPPVSGTKFGLNGFMWNMPADKAQQIWARQHKL